MSKRISRRCNDGNPNGAVVESLETRVLLAAGVPDPTFGQGGVVSPIIGPPVIMNDQANAVALEGDGKILVAGTSRGPISVLDLLRYNSDGTRDLTFGTVGRTGDPLSAPGS